MANLGTKFSSISQEWETPDNLFRPLESQFRFDWDVCATAENTKCRQYYTIEIDALKQEWAGRCWMNPPFNQLGKWVKKAAESYDATVVCLLPARTNTQWWHSYCMRAHEIRFVVGRPIFKGATHGLPQPLAIVIFDHPRGDVDMPLLKSHYLVTGYPAERP